MFFSNEDHLRVTKVRTVDGLQPLVVDDVIQKKVIHAPMSALKFLESQNQWLPNNLKMKIEKVKGYTPAPVQQPDPGPSVSDLQKQLDELKAENEKLIQLSKAAGEARKEPGDTKANTIPNGQEKTETSKTLSK